MVFLTATYTVQDIITTVLPYGLTVECVFAVEQNTCTVFLVLDDSDKGKHQDIYQPTNIGLVLETCCGIYIGKPASP